MKSQIVEVAVNNWHIKETDRLWIDALEGGKILYFPELAFKLEEHEKRLLTPTILDPKVRNISLAGNNPIKGVAADENTASILTDMVSRFRAQSESLVYSLLPKYQGALRLAPTSYRPAKVENRQQSWRADDRRLHVDAFPSRPNYGERILRVFSNINPDGVDRVWRVGEPFEDMVKTMLPRVKPYSSWQAKVLAALGITKSLRSEYDHLMLQLHDQMKSDLDYQANAPQTDHGFAPGSVWMCFSDQALHGVRSGQYMLEQTFHLSPQRQYNSKQNPLAHLQQLTGRPLI